MESLIRKNRVNWNGYISEISCSPGESVLNSPESVDCFLLVSWGRAVQSIEQLCGSSIEINRFETGALIDLSAIHDGESRNFVTIADTILEGWLINKSAFSESSTMLPVFRHELSDKIMEKMNQGQAILSGTESRAVLQPLSDLAQDQSVATSLLKIGKNPSASLGNLLDESKNKALQAFDSIVKFSCT